MLDWLRRKGPPPASEQLLESEGPNPLTDERLGRLLGRLGPDSRTPGEPVAEARNENVAPPTMDRIAPREPAAEVPPPSAADTSFALRREDRTITGRGSGPSAAELLAKGYSFATGPDGKMVVFDTEGNVTDMALPRPSIERSAVRNPEPAEALPEPAPLPIAAREPAAEALQEAEPPPTDDGAAEAPAAEALPEPAPPLADSKKAKKPAPEAVKKPASLREANRKSAKKPLRVFLVDGRNDNRGLRADGTYDQTRDWFYQNVRMQQALTEKGYDVNYSWGIQRHGQKMLQTVFPEMMRWLWRDHGVSTDVHDTVERSFNAPKKKE